jgi:pimeloyl-ACP methyl ester carboxylesterase
MATTYVLTHGAWHGAWCWYKVVPLLESQGHKVIAFDLPSHGIDHTPLAQASLQSYTRRLCQILDEQPDQVVLVGHSMGGATISQAAEERSSAIKTLVYLTAFLPLNGQTVLGDMDEEAQQATVAHYFTLDETQGTMQVNLEHVKELFYHDCEEADIALALAADAGGACSNVRPSSTEPAL